MGKISFLCTHTETCLAATLGCISHYRSSTLRKIPGRFQEVSPLFFFRHFMSAPKRHPWLPVSRRRTFVWCLTSTQFNSAVAQNDLTPSGTLPVWTWINFSPQSLRRVTDVQPGVKNRTQCRQQKTPPKTAATRLPMCPITLINDDNRSVSCDKLLYCNPYVGMH